MKRVRTSDPNTSGDISNSYVQPDKKHPTAYWPVDRWDDKLSAVQPLLDIADEYRILRVPLLGQNASTGMNRNGLCGPTSASMVYNFWQLCQHPDDPEDHYIKMTNSGGWDLRDTSGHKIPFANFATVARSAKGIGYLDANFGEPPSILTAKSEQWVQDKCKLIVDSIKFKCPVVLYSRFSVTSAHQHIITVSGYAKLAGELWLLILDPESLEINKSSRLKKGMYSLAQLGAKVSRDDLKTFNASHNTISLLEGVFEEALGSIYFLKASHLFDAHCQDSGYFNYQNKDAKKVGHYIHHGHKAPSISVPNELVVSSPFPRVTVPFLLWGMKDLTAVVNSMVQSHPAIQSANKTLGASKPASKPSVSGKSLMQMFENVIPKVRKFRDLIEGRDHGT